MSQIIQPEIFKKFENLVAIFTKKPLDFNLNTPDEDNMINDFTHFEKDINNNFVKIISAVQSHILP